MSVRAFTLIELLLVVVLLGVISTLVVFTPSSSFTSLKITDLYDFLHPNGEIIVFSDGSNVVRFDDKNETDIKIDLSLVEVYEFVDGDFQKREFERLGDRDVVFRYREKNGIGESFILLANERYYVFKPFSVIEAKSFEEAKEQFLNTKFAPKEGEVY